MSRVRGGDLHKRARADRQRPGEHRDGTLVELLGDVRAKLAQLDAVTNAANEVARQTPWEIPSRQRRQLGRLTRLLADAAETATTTVDEVDRRLSGALRRRRIARVG